MSSRAVRCESLKTLSDRAVSDVRSQRGGGLHMQEGRMRFGHPSRRLAALGAVAALGVGVVACGSDDSSGGGGGGGGSSKDKEVTIGLITKTESNPFFV